MKIRNLTFISICTLATAAAQAAPFSYEGMKFEVVRMGRSVKVAPAQVSSHLELPAQDFDCAKIEDGVARKVEAIELCKDDKTSSFCRLAANGIRLLAEGRADEDGPMHPMFTQQWKMSQEPAFPADLDAFKAAVARAQRVPAGKVEVIPFSARNAARPALRLNGDALLRKVESMMRFNEENLGRVAKENLFVTKNRLLACDIAAGRAQFAAHSDIRIDHLEVVPEAVIDGAFAVHQYLDKNLEAKTQGLKPFVRAAVTGYLIAKGMDEGRIEESEDELLQPANLFLRLFENPNEQPRLRQVTGRAALKAAAYRDEALSAQLPQDWRIQ